MAKMHSIMFVATDSDANPRWHLFCENALIQSKDIPGVVRLASNVWMLDLTQSVDGLALLCGKARLLNITFGLLPFAEAPQWLPTGYSPVSQNTTVTTSGMLPSRQPGRDEVLSRGKLANPGPF
jgi:hypothetical protein